MVVKNGKVWVHKLSNLVICQLVRVVAKFGDNFTVTEPNFDNILFAKFGVANIGKGLVYRKFLYTKFWPHLERYYSANLGKFRYQNLPKLVLEQASPVLFAKNARYQFCSSAAWFSVVVVVAIMLITSIFLVIAEYCCIMGGT